MSKKKLNLEHDLGYSILDTLVKMCARDSAVLADFMKRVAHQQLADAIAETPFKHLGGKKPTVSIDEGSHYALDDRNAEWQGKKQVMPPAATEVVHDEGEKEEEEK